mmetsp:Transcript_95661/g.205246  ORF Transcript_95661/g.205246 Transcript_95661/m.205246 type:complete len:218 (+) Transcript_95661:206-859(+)
MRPSDSDACCRTSIHAPPPASTSQGLAGDGDPTEVHDALLARFDQGISATVHALEHQLEVVRHKAHLVPNAHYSFHRKEEIGRLLEQRPISSNALVLAGNDLKANFSNGLHQNSWLHLDDAAKNRLCETQELLLVRVGFIICWSLHIIFESHHSARLHDAEGLCEEPLQIRWVAEDLHIIQRIEVAIRKWERIIVVGALEVKPRPMKTFLLRISLCE